MAEQENKNQIVALDKVLAAAKSVKELLYNPDVISRTITGYTSLTKRKDGENKYDHERQAYLEIVFQKPELRQAPNWAHYKVLNKVMHNNWSLRDNRVYIQAVKRGDEIIDIKVDPSPALRRAMLEQMENVIEAPEAQVVCKGDLFVEDKLNHIIIKHESTEKSMAPDKLENITHAYQRIVYKGGKIKDVVVPQFDLFKAKSKSKIKGDGGVWEWVAEACKKVATNRAFRLYHKYPDNSVVFDDSESEEPSETSYEDVTVDQTVVAQTSSGEQVDTDTGEVHEKPARPAPSTEGLL